ncbi:Bromodomain-containing protein, partial [Haematococcus lacustris]
QAPNYSTIITNPMCFDVIRAKIKDNYYANYDMLQADIQLVFDNAMHYNPVGE